MSRYAVTKIRYTSGKLDGLLVHPIEQTDEGEFVPGTAKEMTPPDLANLIQGGDRVTVLLADGDGKWNMGPDIKCETGTDDLKTIHFVNRTRVLLENLPKI